MDYVGIKKQMNLALAQYSKSESANIEEVEASITTVKDQLALLDGMFHSFDMQPYVSGTPLDKLRCLQAAAEFIQVTEKVETRFMGLVKRLKAAYLT